MFLSLALALALPASAANITLDTGATIEGELAVWQVDGDCQISVTDGPMVGSIIIVPCTKVARFERTEPTGGWMAVADPAPLADPAPQPEPLPADEPPALAAIEEEPLAEPALALPATFPVEEAPDATVEPDPEVYGKDLADPLPPPPVVRTRPPEPFSKAPTRPGNRMLGTIRLPEIPRLKNALHHDEDDEDAPIVRAVEDVDPAAPAVHHPPVDPATLKM